MVKVAEVLTENLIKGLNDVERTASDSSVSQLAISIQRFFTGITHMVKQAAERIEIGHSRQQLLSIYRRRHDWKKADLSRLKAYPLNNSALARVEKLKASKGRGRGVVLAYRPAVDNLIATCEFLNELFNPATPPSRRVRMLKQTKWFPHFVEMTYRGEYLRQKEQGTKSPSSRAEEAVAAAFFISVAALKQFRHSVRKSADSAVALSERMDVDQLEIWKKCGEIPECFLR